METNEEKDALVELLEELKVEKKRVLDQLTNVSGEAERKFLKGAFSTIFYTLDVLVSEIAERDADHEMRLVSLEQSISPDEIEPEYFQNVALLIEFCRSLKIEDPVFVEVLDYLDRRTASLISSGRPEIRETDDKNEITKAEENHGQG